MSTLLNQSFQIPVNNWGFPHFLRTESVYANDNWQNIKGSLGVKLFWMLESISFSLDYVIGSVSFNRTYTIKMPLKPNARCCEVQLVQDSDIHDQDWNSTLYQYSFSPIMRLAKNIESFSNIQHAKDQPIFGTRFAFEERDLYDGYTITTHAIDMSRRIIDRYRVYYEGSYFDLYLISEVPALEGAIINGKIELSFYSSS